jgi:hypothetical protein
MCSAGHQRKTHEKGSANSWAQIASAAIAGFLFLSVVLACGLRKPWADYTPKPFDSEKWHKGNRTVRGTMYFDLFEKHTLSGKTKEEVVQLLGEPDKKVQVEGREVWLYRLDVVGEWTSPCFPVSFEPNGKTFAGRIKNGTMSMIVEEKS